MAHDRFASDSSLGCKHGIQKPFPAYVPNRRPYRPHDCESGALVQAEPINRPKSIVFEISSFEEAQPLAGGNASARIQR